MCIRHDTDVLSFNERSIAECLDLLLAHWIEIHYIDNSRCISALDYPGFHNPPPVKMGPVSLIDVFDLRRRMYRCAFWMFARVI